MESKIIIKSKSKLENTESFKTRIEEEVNSYLEQGFKIKASNISNDSMYLYIYILLVKE